MTRRTNFWTTAAEVLTPKQLEALTLHHRADLSHTDIAAHLGITRQAVAERIRKAELRLHQHYGRKAAA